MSSAKRLLLAACVASSFALVGCASDSDHNSSRSDRGANGTYDNASSAGTRNRGGSVGVGPSSSNDNVPNNASRTPARDTTNTGSDSGSRIDGRSGGTGVGNGNADSTTGINNAKPGINGGGGPATPDSTPRPTSPGDGKSGAGVGSGNADTATGVNNVRPGNSDTETPTAKPAAGTDSGKGDVEKK